jgi:hypothetical protein
MKMTIEMMMMGDAGNGESDMETRRRMVMKTMR